MYVCCVFFIALIVFVFDLYCYLACMYSHVDKSEGTLSAAELQKGRGGYNDVQFGKKHYDESGRHQIYQQHNRSSRQYNSRTPDANGAFDEEETFFQTKTSRSHDRKPQMNTVLLYDTQSSGSKSSKKQSGANKTISSYLPKKAATVAEKKRAVSAGRLRKKADSGGALQHPGASRSSALDHMFGDQVIEELDLAMQAGGGARSSSGQQRPRERHSSSR
jgi:hypothetical protein